MDTSLSDVSQSYCVFPSIFSFFFRHHPVPLQTGQSCRVVSAIDPRRTTVPVPLHSWQRFLWLMAFSQFIADRAWQSSPPFGYALHLNPSRFMSASITLENGDVIKLSASPACIDDVHPKKARPTARKMFKKCFHVCAARIAESCWGDHSIVIFSSPRHIWLCRFDILRFRRRVF